MSHADDHSISLVRAILEFSAAASGYSSKASASRDCVVPLHVCLDESGKCSGGHPRVAFGGWISDIGRWSAFADEWDYFLTHHKMRSLHMGVFMGHKEEYQGTTFTWDEKLAIVSTAVQIANRHALGFLACAVDNLAFRAMSDGSRTKCGGDAHLFCCEETVKIVMELFKELDQKEDPSLHYPHPIGLMFDDSREYAVKVYTMLDQIKERNRAWKQRIASTCFADDEIYTPLQAADLAAWLASNRLKALVEHPERHRLKIDDFDSLLALATNGIWVGRTKWFTDEDLKRLDVELSLS